LNLHNVRNVRKFRLNIDNDNTSTNITKTPSKDACTPSHTLLRTYERYEQNEPNEDKTVPALSQLEKLTEAKNLILKHYGYQPISPEGIDYEADTLKVNLSISKDDALQYIIQAVSDRDRGRFR
jgi:hypothetical protein